MIKRILVTLDGSELAEGVLPHVEDLARRLPAEVCFVRVVELHPSALAMQAGSEGMSGAEPMYELMNQELEMETQAARTRLTNLASEWQAKGITATWEVVRGLAAASIVESAHARGVNLIAMSTHGRSGFNRLIFGSVAEQVVRDVGLPVLLIRPAEVDLEPTEEPA
jgi:nucleotide-binding universal stress UspA family protein